MLSFWQNLLNPKGLLNSLTADPWLKASSPVSKEPHRHVASCWNNISKGRESPHPLLMDLLTSLRKDHRFTEIIVRVTGSCNWLLWLRCLENDSLGPHHPSHFNGKGWVVRKYSYDRQGENKQAREKKNHRGLCKVKPFFPRRLRSFCQRFSYSNCLDPVLQQDLSSAKQHALPRHLRTSSRELHSRHN